MDSLLGNYLSLGDLIVVHMCGDNKQLRIKKTHEYLGLTITDNGNGRAFVKKVNSKENSIEDMIKPGDHIAGINSESTIGMQHYQVAKAIREVPENNFFTLHLIEPYHVSQVAEGNSAGSSMDLKTKHHSLKEDQESISLLNFAENNYKNLNQNTQQSMRGSLNRSKLALSPVAPPNFNANLDSLDEDLANSSLPIDRLLSKNIHSLDQVQNFGTDNGQTAKGNKNNGQSQYIHTIEEINSMLESFLGVNDNTLAIQLYRLAKENKESFRDFVKAIDESELRVFNFDEDIESHLWNCALKSI